MKFNLALPQTEWMSILKGALVAAAGAGLTVLSESLAGMSFGPYTAVVVAVLSVAVNMVRKMLVTEPVVAPPAPPAEEQQ